MSDQIESLEPAESGSAGEQEEQDETPESVEIIARSDPGHPLSGTLAEIPSSGIRGETGLALLGGIARYVERDLQDSKASLRACQDELARQTQLYRDEKEKAAVLRERLTSSRQSRWLRNAILTLGALALGYGLEAGSQLPPIAIGAVLLLLGWFAPWPSGGES